MDVYDGLGKLDSDDLIASVGTVDGALGLYCAGDGPTRPRYKRIPDEHEIIIDDRAVLVTCLISHEPEMTVGELIDGANVNLIDGYKRILGATLVGPDATYGPNIRFDRSRCTSVNL